MSIAVTQRLVKRSDPFDAYCCQEDVLYLLSTPTALRGRKTNCHQLTGLEVKRPKLVLGVVKCNRPRTDYIN